MAILTILAVLVFASGCGDDGGTRPTGTPADETATAKFAERGPYVVGVTTLDLGDRDIEVWYPVDPGTEVGAEKASYAAFEVLPDAIQQLLPPDLNLVVPMDAYRDLPVSAAGPFPILTFSHGAGGFRHAYSGSLGGIASHGFVVTSIDHLEQAIDGCRPDNLPPAEFWKVAQHFTVAHMRAAFGLDSPPVGLGDGVADAFGEIAVRYRHEDCNESAGVDDCDGANPRPASTATEGT